MARKLYRSNHDKILGGVCGGIAEYFNIDVTWIRLLVLLLILLSRGFGILLYIGAVIIIPRDPVSKL
ncbi:MAG: PspC domain-containing protein [Desulfitobacteriaceae bacterium]|nr:PspC domain-containing protein [Clostridia bacterium]MDD4345495.1 PspC domain-containing protein [Desulfitobacteriaceae bacterium]MDD4400640.1 PspC domain-containing protein [Desulfitobacteriaceae bacterium]